jgi:hypothetical protein
MKKTILIQLFIALFAMGGWAQLKVSSTGNAGIKLLIESQGIMLSQRGEASQEISGSEFPAGIYLYALIADGQEVDTKRMILTK